MHFHATQIRDRAHSHSPRATASAPSYQYHYGAASAYAISRRKAYRWQQMLCCDGELEPGLVKGARVKFNDSRALKLRRRAHIYWEEGVPQRVLIVKKPRNSAASIKLEQIGHWLQNEGLEVWVERPVHATEFPEFQPFDPSSCTPDFCVSLGGDGTVLHLASLFGADQPLPPIMSFSMGSLGFLTPFDVDDFRNCLARVLSKQPLFCTLRGRKRCEVRYKHELVRVHHVFNECAIDRGSFPGAVLLEICIDGSFVTTVEADGLIIATPSGSTAYSMSAGGSIVAPSVPCTLLTPLAPLSLSFRPLIVPESSTINIHLPFYARSNARASFDGKNPMKIQRNTTFTFSPSLFPVPLINLGRLDSDWYEGITQKLKWNQAIRRPPALASTLSMDGSLHSGEFALES